METFDLVQAELNYEGLDVNKHLSGLFPERTLEMIKSKRRLADYRALRERLRAEREEAAPDPDSPPPVSPAPSSPLEDDVFVDAPLSPAPPTSVNRTGSPRNTASLADELQAGPSHRVTRSQSTTGRMLRPPPRAPDTASSSSPSPPSTPPDDDDSPPPSPAPPEPTPPPPAAPPTAEDAVRDYIREILPHPSIPLDVVTAVDTILGHNATPEAKKEVVEGILITIRNLINPSAPPRPGRPTEDRSRLRRPQQYRLAQQLWEKDRAQLAEGIIDGTLLSTPDNTPTMEALEEVSIYNPVTVEELTATLTRK